MKVKLILAVFFGVIVASHGAPCSDEGDCTLADDGKTGNLRNTEERNARALFGNLSTLLPLPSLPPLPGIGGGLDPLSGLFNKTSLLSGLPNFPGLPRLSIFESDSPLSSLFSSKRNHTSAPTKDTKTRNPASAPTNDTKTPAPQQDICKFYLFVSDNTKDGVVGTIKSWAIVISTNNATDPRSPYRFTGGGSKPAEIPERSPLTWGRVVNPGLRSSERAAWVKSITDVTIEIKGLTHQKVHEVGAGINYFDREYDGFANFYPTKTYNLLTPRGTGSATDVDLEFADNSVSAISNPFASGSYVPYDWETSSGSNTLTSFFKTALGSGSCLV